MFEICTTPPGVYTMTDRPTDQPTDRPTDVNFRHSSQYCKVSKKLCTKKGGIRYKIFFNYHLPVTTAKPVTQLTGDLLIRNYLDITADEQLRAITANTQFKAITT